MRPAAILALALLLAPNPALAQARVGLLFSVRNDTRAPIRCMLYEGGPIFHLITIGPGKTHTERVAPRAASVSLACPKVRDTVFGPLAPGGRYAFVRRKGRVDLIQTSGAAPS
jgi:hypothetical protein